MALTVKTFDLGGNETGETALAGAVFDVAARDHLLFEALVCRLAGRRQGTAKVKTRAEVRGGGRKPYRQKGTGNARRGTERSPLVRGGGRIFGPVPRDYSYRLPRKVRREALRVALTQKRREGKVAVIEKFALAEPKTKSLRSLLDKIQVSGALVLDRGNGNLEISARNLPGVKYLDPDGLNVFDILKYDTLLFSSEAIEAVQKELAE